MKWRVVLCTTLAWAALAVLAGTFFVAAGVYDVAATGQHTQPVYSLLEKAMHRSVRMRAGGLQAPSTLNSAAALRRGALCYREHCVQCHGGPGVARDPIGQAMQPVPGPLIDSAKEWRLRELYWIVRNGIKMSGMPAWEFHMSDADLWAVSAFVAQLPALSPADYALRAAQDTDESCRRAVDDGNGAGPLAQRPARSQPAAVPPSAPPQRNAEPPAAIASAAPSAARGQVALHQYACHACHAIPGITGTSRQVGPPLAGMAAQQLVAGRLANTPDNLAAWIRAPQRFDPLTAMPDLGVTARDAGDMAAYLSTLR